MKEKTTENKAKKEKTAESSLDSGKLGKELGGLFSIFFGLLLMLSLATFDSRDPWLNHVVSGTPKIYNKAGLFGTYTGGLLLDLLGCAAWVVPAFFCITGARRILSSPPLAWWRWFGVALMAIVVAFAGASNDMPTQTNLTLEAIATHGGGLLGNIIYGALVQALSPTGAWLIWTLCLLLSVQMLVGFSWLVVLAGAASALWRTSVLLAEEALEKRKNAKDSQKEDYFQHTAEPIKALEPAPTKDNILSDPVQNFDKNLFKGVTFEEFSSEENPLLETEYYENEEELPPWVRDFEEGKHGVESQESLTTNITHDKINKETTAPSEHKFNVSKGGDLSLSLESENSPLDFVVRERTLDTDPKDTTIIDDSKSISTKAVELISKVSRKLLLPPLGLIENVVSQGVSKASREQLEEKGRTLMTCLTDFGIQGELVGITPGPVVTMFEIRPAPGVRVSRIANLSDDFALALKAVAVRIQAPVPGTDTVGIEIPNEIRETVGLKELLASEIFQNSSSLLTLAIGKDIAGQPAVADLATMPHLLVAGATGAGKSVGINSILLSILYKAKPDQVQLLLVDPKRVEMAIYADLPHLVHPVVTDMQMAKNALDWAVKEMEERYSSIARAGVRNIADYNEKLKALGDKRPEGMEGLEPMPYLVIIIDELADLMLVAAKEVETSIVRLAQLARAAGIHLILATQRPSVDVVTGIIKANFPCRISFQVTSKHDSRTILDAVGAEHLLGKGDMLFKPSGGRFKRMHGAFVSDKTVQAVVDFWKAQQKPSYTIDFAEWGVAELTNTGSDTDKTDIVNDPIYDTVLEFVLNQKSVSISFLQRRFSIGFNKSAKIVEQLERDGIIGAADGSKPRQVLRNI